MRLIGVVGYAGSEDGYVLPRKTCRPRPTELTVEHFLHDNRFSGFSQREKKAAAAQQDRPKTTTTSPKAQTTTTPPKAQTTSTSPKPHATGQQRKASATALCAAQAAARSKKLDDELDAAVDAAIRGLSILEYECESGTDQLLACAPAEMTVLVAADTGAVDHVIPIGALPHGCAPDGIFERHFGGANDAHIEAYGGCDTMMSTREGPMACKYQVADVARTLHSVSRTTCPADGPGNFDVIFNNRLGAVVPAGIVDKILEKIKPILQYDRRGGLYCAEVKLSSFPRPALKQ
jgi:hypothetical protein